MDTAHLRNLARAAGARSWVAPLSSPRDVVVPAAHRGALPVTIVSAPTRAEAQFITAFDPPTVIDLLDGAVPDGGRALLREFALSARPGARTARRTDDGAFEVSAAGEHVVARTDAGEIVPFLETIDQRTALALLG